MAEPLKFLIHAGLVQRMGAHLRRADRHFDSDRFVALASAGLDTLELKARALHLADALEATLPSDFDTAAGQIEAALAPPWPDLRGPGGDTGRDGLEGWALWPVGVFVTRRGLATPERALQTLHALTQRFTAEWALRPFIELHPNLVFDTLMRWTQDESAHVRRLVSEGSRPRLPWGQPLRSLIRDPAPTLPLLAALQDDPSDYVRRSVANHLNDIARDHPDVVVRWVQTHLPQASAARRDLLRHASRVLVKNGHAPMLQAWGLGQALRGSATLALAPDRILLGESLQLTVTLNSTSRRAQRLVVDYAVHHVKADGRLSPKVFKGWALELAPHAGRTLVKTHPLRPITTRRYHGGRHALDLRVNGQVLASAEFDLDCP